MNRYISKSYTRSKNTIDRQYTKLLYTVYRAGAAVVSTITSIIFKRQNIECKDESQIYDTTKGFNYNIFSVAMERLTWLDCKGYKHLDKDCYRSLQRTLKKTFTLTRIKLENNSSKLKFLHIF